MCGGFRKHIRLFGVRIRNWSTLFVSGGMTSEVFKQDTAGARLTAAMTVQYWLVGLLCLGSLLSLLFALRLALTSREP